MMAGSEFALHLAAGGVGVACVVLGVIALAMQAGHVIAGHARRNPAIVIVSAAFGVAMATLGFDLLTMVMK